MYRAAFIYPTQAVFISYHSLSGFLVISLNMWVQLYIPVCLCLTGVILGDPCNSPALVECTCHRGERDGLLLVCAQLPTVLDINEVAMRVLHMFIKRKVLSTVQYDENIWPRLASIQDKTKTLICRHGLCAEKTLTTKQFYPKIMTTHELITQQNVPTVKSLTTAVRQTNKLEMTTDTIEFETEASHKTDKMNEIMEDFENVTSRKNNEIGYVDKMEETTVVLENITKSKIDKTSYRYVNIKSREIAFIISLCVSIIINICLIILSVIHIIKRRQNYFQSAAGTDIEMQDDDL